MLISSLTFLLARYKELFSSVASGARKLNDIIYSVDNVNGVSHDYVVTAREVSDAIVRPQPPVL